MKAVDKKKLKSEAHSLNPIVTIGQSGLTDAVLAELEQALDHHELLKVKIRAERDDRKVISEKICTSTGAELIQSIGQVIVIYRLNPNK
ncbi:MAG: ribosome assembly RNA-binding protein YhbY [Methylococcales bacterium]|nr:ribosome assembly RNA-binding protein YhbY [Methylococcales bacterium]MDP3837563.1 ribosome assembly RNA-binding protein YhbY [Methylococcales bacterium]